MDNLLVDAASSFGQRIYQEDAVYASKGILAVADGYCKGEVLPNGGGQKEFSGFLVSSKVISKIKEEESLLTSRCNQDVLSKLNEQIDGLTSMDVAGSTLALAVCVREKVVAAVLGDSTVIRLSVSGHLSIIPRLGVGLKLWGCFGDLENRRVHTQNFQVTSFLWNKGDVVLVCSDGLLATTKTKLTESRAGECARKFRDGAKAMDLVNIAMTSYESQDNISVLGWKFI